MAKLSSSQPAGTVVSYPGMALQSPCVGTPQQLLYQETSQQLPYQDSSQSTFQGTPQQQLYQRTSQQPFQGTAQQPPHQGTSQPPPFPEPTQTPYLNTASPVAFSAGQKDSAVPSAPSVDQMDRFQGYEQVSFSTTSLTPPPNTFLQGASPVRETVQDMPIINEEIARDALLEFVNDNCCYGKGAAEEMVFKDILPSCAFHYTLESFTEKRDVVWKYEPYTGQVIDSPMNGSAPGPWDIMMHPPQQFKNSQMKMEVPRTASLKPCYACIGLGRQRCKECLGNGQVHCFHCNGTGCAFLKNHNKYQDSRLHHQEHDDQHHHHHQHQENMCFKCYGTGKIRCKLCTGSGQMTCNCCSGMGQLKCYIELTVTWSSHLDDHIVERTAISDNLIREVSGQVAFKEESPQVWPVTHFPDAVINTASKNLVEKHAHLFTMEKILMQRHSIRLVPVYHLLYQWKGKEGGFYIYGFENRVYFPDYPQNCCCGLCTIL